MAYKDESHCFENWKSAKLKSSSKKDELDSSKYYFENQYLMKYIFNKIFDEPMSRQCPNKHISTSRSSQNFAAFQFYFFSRSASFESPRHDDFKFGLFRYLNIFHFSSHSSRVISIDI